MKMARSKSTKAAPEAKPSPQTAQQKTITLVGRLCADPVLHQTKSGKSVTTIRLAVDVPGGETAFRSVVVWNRTAEVVCQYLKKGRAVEVVGVERERSYTAADGDERQVTEVIAFRVQFLSRQAKSPAQELS
jgi:single-strand DNA-binding protein